MECQLRCLQPRRLHFNLLRKASTAPGRSGCTAPGAGSRAGPPLREVCRKRRISARASSPPACSCAVASLTSFLPGLPCFSLVACAAEGVLEISML